MGDQALTNDGIPEKKKVMTDEERLQLSEKLDKDLDDWMDSLEKKAYNEGWPEDRWEQEMEKHPFFMTKFPENPSDASPLMQGIQQLKYDENENTPEDLALSYKEDGNFNFKHKKYRMAVISYTEGIRRKCGNSEVEASLYNNRSAAQFFLGNYRSSLMDIRHCLKLQPGHDKAEMRAIQCCIKLKEPKDAFTYCKSYLKRHPDCVEVKKLYTDALKIQKNIENDKRKDLYLERRQLASTSAVLNAVAARGVKVEVEGDAEEVLLGMHEKPGLLPDGSLTWPVFFLYPEYSTSDFVQEFNENNTIISILEEIFSESPEWDAEKRYKPDTLSVYYEASDRSHLFQVDVNKNLAKIVLEREFVARDWRPAFLVFVQASLAEENFLKNYTVCSL